MSDLITTVYPTAGMESKTWSTVTAALYNAINSISNITDFFTVTTETIWTENGVYLKRGSTSKARITCPGNSSTENTMSASFPAKIAFQETNSGGNSKPAFTYGSPETSDIYTTDIPVRFATGINGTKAMWLDDYSKGCVLVYETHGGLDLVMSSAAADDISFYIANTDASTAKSLPMPCNGDLIGTGTPYVCQPYFWNGINTGDIYTFDCGSDSIPFGEFWIGDKHFVSLYSNFALRLE